MPTIQASEFKAKCLEQFLGNCHARAARTYRSVPAGDRVALRTAAARVREIALDGRIGIRATQLENLHGDPADRFIVATSLQQQAALITADENLLTWQSELVRQHARV